MNNSSTPRANYLDKKDLKKIAKEDMKMDGKGRPDDYEFGKIKTWKGTKDRIFFMAHVNAGSPSTSLQVVPGDSRRRGKQTTKLLIDAPKLMREGASSTTKESEEAFERINKMLGKVLVEARQLSALRQISLAGCTIDEANYDELAKQGLVDQTASLVASFEQHNAYQRMCCNRNLTPIVETVEEAPIRTRKTRNEVEEKLEGMKRTRTQKKRIESRAKTKKKHSEDKQYQECGHDDGSNTEHEHAYKTSTAICANTRELARKGSSLGIVTSQEQADHKDPLNFRVYDDNKIKERVMRGQLGRFFDIKEGEDLQDHDMFLLPTGIGGFVNQKTTGHFVAITVNMTKQRFELLNSIKDYSEARQFFTLVARNFKKIWKEIGSKIQLSPSNIDHFKEFDVHVPLQGPDSLDCAFYMYMNVKHYSEERTTISLTEEQVPELRKRILYHLLSEHIGNTNLILLNYMLKHKVVTEDLEMEQVQCGMTELEIPQFPKETDTYARDTQAIEVLDSEDDPPEEEVALFLESLTLAQVDTYNELEVKGQMDFQHFETTLMMEAKKNFNKEVNERQARLQLDSPDMLYGITNIPTFEHQHFIHMDTAKALHDYLMSNEGQKECRKEMETKRKGNWQVNFLEEMPMVNKVESAYVALKLAFVYNGIKFVKDIDHFDDDLEIWKAETLYMLLLSEVNEVKPHAMGQEIIKYLPCYCRKHVVSLVNQRKLRALEEEGKIKNPVLLTNENLSYEVNMIDETLRSKIHGAGWRKLMSDYNVRQQDIMVMNLDGKGLSLRIDLRFSECRGALDELSASEKEYVNNIDHTPGLQLSYKQMGHLVYYLFNAHDLPTIPFVHHVNVTNIKTGRLRIPSVLLKTMKAKFVYLSPRGVVSLVKNYNEIDVKTTYSIRADGTMEVTRFSGFAEESQLKVVSIVLITIEKHYPRMQDMSLLRLTINDLS
ncbi:hypothetical protein D1007_04617 [Hordeum vulgare]|nr:hypothetical protein D1007_04617 [Hordeum vulgare]